MKAGFHTADITPALGMEAPGGYGKVYIQRIHDPLKVRAAVFESGETTVAFVGIDTCYLQSAKVIQAIHREVERRCGIPADHVLLASSHTHSGGPGSGRLPEEFADAPELVRELALSHSTHADPLYCDWLIRQAVTAICEAHRKREAALISAGSGHEDQVAFNRRFKMANGRVYTHPSKGNPEIVEPAGPTDPEVGVLAAWNLRGELLGCLVNYACHADASPDEISANWIYYLEKTIRGAMGEDVIVVFLQGASGDVENEDQLTSDKPREGEDAPRLVGERVGAEAVKVLVTAYPGDFSPLDTASRVLQIKRRVPDRERVRKCIEVVQEEKDEKRDTSWIFAKEIVLLDALLTQHPVAEVEVQAVQVGPAVFLSNPAELFCQFGLDIKSKSPFKFTYPVELANGCVGYVPTEEAFGPQGGGYETRLTSYSNLEPTAGRQMVETALELAGKLKPGAVPEPPKAAPFDPRENSVGSHPWPKGNVPPELS